MKSTFHFAVILMCAVCVVGVGCKGKKSSSAKSDNGKSDSGKSDSGKSDSVKTDSVKTDIVKTDTPKVDDPKVDDHGHDGDDDGPHGGVLLELGNHDYHVEIVIDQKTDSTTVYIFNGKHGDAMKPVAVDAKEASISYTAHDELKTEKLAAKAMEGETGGKSSRFVSGDHELAEHVFEKGAKGRFTILIGSTPFSVDIPGTKEHHDD